MPINHENVVARALAARAASPAFLAWRAVAQQERLFRDTVVAVRRQWNVVRIYRSLTFELLLRCFYALADKPQPRFTLRV